MLLTFTFTSIHLLPFSDPIFTVKSLKMPVFIVILNRHINYQTIVLSASDSYSVRNRTIVFCMKSTLDYVKNIIKWSAAIRSSSFRIVHAAGRPASSASLPFSCREQSRLTERSLNSLLYNLHNLNK